MPARPKEKNGVVYTRRWVVDLILDLAGYLPAEPLAERLLVEPSAGDARPVPARRRRSRPVSGPIGTPV